MVFMADAKVNADANVSLADLEEVKKCALHLGSIDECMLARATEFRVYTPQHRHLGSLRTSQVLFLQDILVNPCAVNGLDPRHESSYLTMPEWFAREWYEPTRGRLQVSGEGLRLYYLPAKSRPEQERSYSAQV
jgi:hypothetical protein